MGAPVDGGNPLEHRHLLIKMCCGTEDAAGGISPDAESTYDWRGEEPENER